MKSGIQWLNLRQIYYGMKRIFSKKWEGKQAELDAIIAHFDSTGQLFDDRKRNQIKMFPFGEMTLNVKSFKVPNAINRIVYRFFRPSKAQRSFEYAAYLLANGIGTPQPIAYYLELLPLGFGRSYYISEHQAYDLTYRELVEDRNYPDWETILRQFTRFTYDLHQKGIEFKDHSPGNTLITQTALGEYSFALVDLNRMAFHREMPIELRMKNMCRLTPHEEMVRIMCNEYAKVSGVEEEKLFALLWKMTQDFQYRFYRKKRIKQKLKFWKK